MSPSSSAARLFPDPAGYHHEILTLGHLGDVVALHRTVIDALPPEQKDFFLQKGENELRPMLATTEKEAGKIVGIFQQGRLVACATVALPTPRRIWNDLVCPQFLATQSLAIWEVAILQSAAVHPAHRGHRLQQALVYARQDVAHQKGRAAVVAEIAVSNVGSRKNYEHTGFSIWGEGVDPADGCELVYYGKRLVNQSACQNGQPYRMR